MKKHKYSDLTIIQVAIGNIVTQSMKDELQKDYNLVDVQITDNSALNELQLQDLFYGICDSVHAHCSNDCPVYLLNGSKVPMNEDGNNCRFFKSGIGMSLFLKSKFQELDINSTNEEIPSIHELAHIASELVIIGTFAKIREAGDLLIDCFQHISDNDRILLIGYTVRYINNDSLSGQLLGYLEGNFTK